MKLFDVIKFFSFDEKCIVYTNDDLAETAQFEGAVSSIPYWLCQCELMKDGGIGVEYGTLYFVVEV